MKQIWKWIWPAIFGLRRDLKCELRFIVLKEKMSTYVVVYSVSNLQIHWLSHRNWHSNFDFYSHCRRLCLDQAIEWCHLQSNRIEKINSHLLHQNWTQLFRCLPSIPLISDSNPSGPLTAAAAPGLLWKRNRENFFKNCILNTCESLKRVNGDDQTEENGMDEFSLSLIRNMHQKYAALRHRQHLYMQNWKIISTVWIASFKTPYRIR